MSDVCRGLIGILRGDDTEMYWASLSIKFSDIQRQQLRLQAQKIPRKDQTPLHVPVPVLHADLCGGHSATNNDEHRRFISVGGVDVEKTFEKTKKVKDISTSASA